MGDEVTLAQLLDHRSDAGSVPVELLAQGEPAAGAPAAGLGVGGNPDVTMQQVFQNAFGPLPLSAQFTAHGGTFAIFVAWSGRIANFQQGNWYPVGVYVTIDGQYVGQSIVGATQDALLTSSNVLIAGNVDYGEHTIAIQNFKDNLGMGSSEGEFNLTLLEL